MRVTITIFVIALTSLSCGKDDEKQATESLIGKWNITETYYEEGNRVEFGSQPDTSFSQNNTGEYIDFKSEVLVSYNYSVNGELHEAEGEDWSLDSRTRKSGFTNSKAYFLLIKGEELEVQFGDGTSDSHENASEAKILFIDNIENIGPYKSYQLTISKE